MKKIVYFGHGWAENVGNAFVDMGINYQLNTLLSKNLFIILATLQCISRNVPPLPIF